MGGYTATKGYLRSDRAGGLGSQVVQRADDSLAIMSHRVIERWGTPAASATESRNVSTCKPKSNSMLPTSKGARHD
jgi:hypothetical protein